MKELIIKKILLATILMAQIYSVGFADQENIELFRKLLKNETAQYFGGAEVAFFGSVQWVSGDLPEHLQSVSIYGDDGKGNLHFMVKSATNDHAGEGWVQFSAWISAKVAIKRIYPGEILSPNLFVTQKVSVSSGLGREFRGLIYPVHQDILGFEAVQSILQGQFLVNSAVQKVPDIRRGDSVKIRLVAGDVSLSASAIAEESGYISKRIRVMTIRGKKELSGVLKSGQIVEVRL